MKLTRSLCSGGFSMVMPSHSYYYHFPGPVADSKRKFCIRAITLGLKLDVPQTSVTTISPLDATHKSGSGKPIPEKENVGAFQRLPMVVPADEIVGSALRKARRVQATKGITNIAKRERNRGAKQLDALMKELSVPLGVYLQKFPQPHHLHPYEQSLLELTLGEGKYEEVLGSVDILRKKIIHVGKNLASLCAKSTTKREANEWEAEGFLKLEEVFKTLGIAVDDLKEVAKVLRAMPVVHLHVPTLCLVGAPNVGKSSLVRVLSSGKPEVCNYPFTTRGISMGHINIGSQVYQVTDTPGLLKRPDDERNNLEKLTLAALMHLPTAILYVHDLTGDCGVSVNDQFLIYKHIKQRFSRRPWLDAVSKVDLLPECTMHSRELTDEIEYYRLFGPPGALHVSVNTGQNIAELSAKVHSLLGDLAAEFEESTKESDLSMLSGLG